MSHIDELIAEHCPEGVEFRDLGDVIQLNFGDRITKLKDSGTQFPVYGGGGESFRTDSFNREDEFVISRFAMSATCVRRVSGRFWLLDSGFTFNPSTVEVLKDYVAHWLLNKQRAIYECSSQGAQKNLKTAEFKKFRIPVPPLPVQRAIVEILDKFTQLEAELEAELEARKQQYEHYRNRLLNSSSSSPWMTLGDIGHVAMCKRIFKDQTASSGDIPFFKIGTFGGEPDAFISRTLYEDFRRRFSFPNVGDVLLSAAGTIGRAIPYDGRDAYFQDSNIVWLAHDETVVLNGYLRHWYQIVSWATDGGTIKRLYNQNLLKTKILVPPLDEQLRIVAILDKFDALVNDLSAGLPAELAARRQQYEYYRDKLLTFKELEVVA